MADKAVVVGVRDYANFPHLTGPCNDAKAMYDWLVDSRGGRFQPQEVSFCHTCLFGGSSQNPNESELDNIFRPLLVPSRIGQRLFIYSAGHGFGDPQRLDDAALLSADADPNLYSHLPVVGYAEWFRRNASFDEIVVAMDCCRLTNPLWSIRPLTAVPPRPGANANAVRCFYAFATGWGQVSREANIGGVPRGVFTVALLEALTHASADADGKVYGSAVSDYIHNVINKLAPGGMQVDPPVIRFDPRRDVVLSTRTGGGPAPGLPVTVCSAPSDMGAQLEILGMGHAIVQTLTITSGRTLVQLSPGFYGARVSGRQTVPFEVPAEGDVHV